VVGEYMGGANSSAHAAKFFSVGETVVNEAPCLLLTALPANLAPSRHSHPFLAGEWGPRGACGPWRRVASACKETHNG
jgi:hypothetical protein